MKHNNRTRDYFVKFDKVEDNGWFCGYASVPVVDSQGDTILPGSFQMSLNTRKPKLLWNHDPGQPIGSVRAIKDTKSGLYFEADLNLDVSRAKEVYSLMKRGDIDGISIGYRPVKGKYKSDPVNGGLIMNEVELFEISIVSIPANSSARIEAVKSQEDLQRKSGLVERFRELTDEQVNFLETLLNLMESLRAMDPAQPAQPEAEVEAVETNSEDEEEGMDIFRYLGEMSNSTANVTATHEKSQSMPLADDAAQFWAALNSLVTKGDNNGPKENSRRFK